MRRIKSVLRSLAIIITLSLFAILVLESESMVSLRNIVAEYLSFFNGKRATISNIFMGIFASAFCMYIGECVNLYYMKKILGNKIRHLFDEIWVKLSFRNGVDRQSYIDHSKEIVPYQNEIQNLYQEYDDKKTHEGKVIFFLDWIVKYYSAIYENEYMKNSNQKVFEEYHKQLQKVFEGGVDELYSISEMNEQVIELRRIHEKFNDSVSEYSIERDKYTDEYITKIKELEKDLHVLYNNQVKIIVNENEKLIR